MISATEALATAPPLGSLTVPLRPPVCAARGDERSAISAITLLKLTIVVILIGNILQHRSEYKWGVAMCGGLRLIVSG